MPFLCFRSSRSARDSVSRSQLDTPRIMDYGHSRIEQRRDYTAASPNPKTKRSFLAPDSPNLWSPPPYSASTPQPHQSASSIASDSPYAFLREFDTIFVVDDSSSMAGHRWQEAEDAIAAIAPLCTSFDQDGIDIYFLNHRNRATRSTTGAYRNVTTAADVREIFQSVQPRGPTPFGRRLHEILGPYMRRLERIEANAADGYGNQHPACDNPGASVKPLNIIAITDGEFTDDAQSVIVDVAKRLDGPLVRAMPWQVGVQFFQVGDDEAARVYLQALDDDLGVLSRQENLRDIVDTVPWRGHAGQTLNADGILKCVLGAVNRKYDKRDAFQ
ncbi:hypothetical protein BDV59DRAFT_201531 [Aspergillus ambiguus]|uniref:uncharacterized protein n=1 Tax=Aspergillus ambiguus TaxID=176160 RepID=UPI003CCD2462